MKTHIVTSLAVSLVLFIIIENNDKYVAEITRSAAVVEAKQHAYIAILQRRCASKDSDLMWRFLQVRQLCEDIDRREQALVMWTNVMKELFP